MIYKKTILLSLIAITSATLLSGCAGDSYNMYDSRSYEDRKIDYTAQNAVNSAAASLSAQDIKNINNLK
ncbi:hypothetical protein MNB_SV-5-1576 [hydrothermal vent metagenome]|uniref:Lipoprotein n=1 Tax=hydrothermal vent metagenome TaxID=652676 RepID=A0A1W1EF02_9ZZZZ